MKYTIGLDIGIASVGWAVINNEVNRIEDLGVRTFRKAEEPDGRSLSFVRCQARGVRRRIRRKATRMRKVKELLEKYKLVSCDELDTLYIVTQNTVDVWELRALGLDRELDRKEWARVLTNIAKRRGYKSNRKIDLVNVETGKLSKATLENKSILERKGYRTIGEMFFKDAKFKGHKRNKAGEYKNTVLRSLLIQEINILFEAQRKYGNKYASKELESEYLEIITFQKEYITPELLEKMLGKCTFEKQEYRAPKNSYSFERFMLLQKVNNLKIEIDGEKNNLTPTQRDKIIALAYVQSEIKYSQIRKKLNLPENARFVELNYNKNTKTNVIVKNIKDIENKRFVKLEGWNEIKNALKTNQKEFEKIKQNPEMQNIIADALVRNKTDEAIKNYLQEKNIDQTIINAVLNINFTKFGHLSYKAMNKIIPELEKGLTYDKACESAGYLFNYTKKELQYKLPAISDTNENIINPVVLRAVSQARKVINAIIDKYGSPIAIHIETARELSKSYEERLEIQRKQKANSEENAKIKQYIIKQFENTNSREWIERNITDTKYISQFMYNYISNHLQFADSNMKRKVYNINGKATAILRHYWGLKKDRDESDKHHAQDAVIIACATAKNIKRVSDYSRKRVLHINNEIIDSETGEIITAKYNMNLKIKEPWPHFKQEVEDKMENIFVSRMPERKVTGKAHKDTMRSLKFIKNGYNFTAVKKDLRKITKQEIQEIVTNPECKELYFSDKAMYDDIYLKLKEADFKSEKAFQNEYRKHSKKGKGPIVRSIKVPLMGKARSPTKKQIYSRKCKYGKSRYI